MDSKATFESMMNIAKTVQDEGLEAIQLLFGDLIGDLNFLELYQKPEIQRLLSSTEMKDAIRVSDIPILQSWYNRIYQDVTVKKSFEFGYLSTYYLALIVPIVLLILTFVFLTYKLLKNWKSKEVTKDEKKRLRQLKKENAEAQRRLQLTKRH